MNAAFEFDSEQDIAFIPFMPATTEDNVELRIQLRRIGSNESLNLIVSVDEEKIIEVQDHKCGTFAFFKHTRKYTAGKHVLTVKYKGSHESAYTIEKITFSIDEKRLPLLQGGFVMLGPPNDRIPCSAFCADTKKMTDTDWSNYIDELYKIGIKCVIIKCVIQLDYMNGKPTAHYESAFYPRSDITAKDPIKAILAAAEKNGQHVFMGLGHTFRGHLPDTTGIMAELFEKYGDSPAFYGWYGSEEVNMSTDNDKAWEQWDEISAQIKKLAPVKPFIISPFANITLQGNTDVLHPKFLEKLGKGYGKFDIIAPQDMVGHTIAGGRLTVKRSGNMFRLLEEQCKKSGKHLWANCEAFDFDDHDILVPRFNGGGFDGENGYIQQLQACFPYVEKITTFMFNGFFAPPKFIPLIGGKRAVEQYQKYSNYRMNNL